MSLTAVIIRLVGIGFVLFLISLFEIDATIKKIIHALVIFAVIIWLLQAVGAIGPMGITF